MVRQKPNLSLRREAGVDRATGQQPAGALAQGKEVFSQQKQDKESNRQQESWNITAGC